MSDIHECYRDLVSGTPIMELVNGCRRTESRVSVIGADLFGQDSPSTS